MYDHSLRAAQVQADRIRNYIRSMQQEQAERIAKRDAMPEGRARDIQTHWINNTAQMIDGQDDELELLKAYIEQRKAELTQRDSNLLAAE